MRVRAHIAGSIVLGGVLYYIFKSVPMSISAVLSGVLIDLDHVLDCYINFGRKFKIRDTIKICESCELKKAYLFLHSYELLFIYSLMAWRLNLGPVWYGIALGLAFHVILDALFNCYQPNSLFFIARYKRQFDYVKIIDADAQLIKYNATKRK